MRRRTLAVIVGAIAAACLWQPTSPLHADVTENGLVTGFSYFFQQHVADEDITGAAFVIASRSGIVGLGTAGYTDTTRLHAIDQDTVFRVASVSKTFAAGLTGILIREGRFSWGDRVVDHVPDFRINGDSSQVRIEHLLGQSTGLMPHAYDNLIEDGLATRTRTAFSA